MGDLIRFPTASSRTRRPAPGAVREAPEVPEVAEPLWRESVGRVLREARLARGQRLVDVAERAGVSPQYLSEVERGLKDPSSELLAAMAGALGLTISSVATQVGSTPMASSRPQGPLCLATALA